MTLEGLPKEYMANIDISTLDEKQKIDLIDNRWKSSSSVWDIIDRVYKANTAIYENRANWLTNIPYIRQQWVVQANRIFVNMEAVINSLIANPPGVNVLPARKGTEAQYFSSQLENYLRKKYLDRNIKETMRKAYRNLYFSRLMMVKPFWNNDIDDFDFRAVDPRKVRVGKYASKEQDTEFAIEEIEDNLCSVVERFSDKKKELMKKYGFNDEADMYIKNPDVAYKEAHIGDWVICKLDNIVLDTFKNPYWDWEGILVTPEEEAQINGNGDQQPALQGDARRQLLQQIKQEQQNRQPAPVQEEKGIIGKGIDMVKGFINPQTGQNPVNEPDVNNPAPEYKKYFYNYFDTPRKPYIFATIFNNENTPIGRTDMITLCADLQRGIDKRKMDIDQNCEMVNGIMKVDASVMGKSDAQRMRFETKGIVWGKGVKDGVTREVGQGLPQMVFDDMLDSRSEIDNIMAASSAFRGEREGQETKAGRLALIQQSYLRLNELVQVGDYMAKEINEWGMQMIMTRYTEYHEAKWTDKDNKQEIIELIQDDFEKGHEVTIIAGKTLPVDDEWKFEQAQNDFKQGALGLTDYLRISKYDDPKDLSKNAVAFKINPVVSAGFTPEEVQTLQPPQTEEKPPNVTINYADLGVDSQVQLLAKIGIQANPNVIIAKEMADRKDKQVETGMKIEAQKHSQTMAEKTHSLSEKQANESKPKPK